MLNSKKLSILLSIKLSLGTCLTEVYAVSSKPSKEESEKTSTSSALADPVAAQAAKIVEDASKTMKEEAKSSFAEKTEVVTKADSPKTKFDITQGFSSLAEKVIPAVVNISTTQVIEGRDKGNVPQFAPGSPLDEFFKDFFDQMEKPRRVQSLGSGFIIKNFAKDGENFAYIVTNYHVIADAKKITVILHDNTELEAALHGIDERTDIALLKVKTDSLPAERRTLPVLEWGNSHDVKVGDWVLAIGNPFGLGSTVTSGIISNRSRDINLRPNSRSRISEYVDDFLQHDASINMGNSGGPLVDLNGKVIGVNTAIFSPSGGNVGIGFSSPAALVSVTIEQLMDYGRTKRGWLGVRIQNVSDDMAESYGLGSKAKGAIVASVTPKGPAAIAGIEPGDIILEFNNREINEKNKLSRVVGETEVGKTVKVKLWRKGKEITVNTTLGEFETSIDSASTEQSKGSKTTSTDVTEVLGMKISKLTAPLSQQYQVNENVKGVIVVNINSDSTVATTGIRPGDVIVEANQREITLPEEFSKQIEEVKKLNRKNITLLVNRRGEMIFFTVKLKDDFKLENKDSKKG